MFPYQKMYAILCCACSDALDLLPDSAETEAVRRMLTEALEEAEELYLQAE